VGTLANASASAIYFFRAKANTAITVSTMTATGARPVPPYAYNVYIVLEQILTARFAGVSPPGDTASRTTTA
jgi:hypothetical protein